MFAILTGDVPILCVSTKSDLVLNGSNHPSICQGYEQIVCSSKLNLGIDRIRQFVQRVIMSVGETTSKKSKKTQVLELLSLCKTKERPSLKITRESSTLWRSSSQPDCSLNTVVPWISRSAHSSPRGSQGCLYKMPMSQSAHLNEVFKKYGYQRKVDSPSPLSASIGNIASNVRTSTNLLVRNVQDTISRFAAA